MIATFCHHQDDEEGGALYLLVLVTDGTRTFRGRIDPREATHRVPWNQQQYCVLNNASSSSSSSNANPPTAASADIRDEIKVQILSNFLLEDDPKDVIVVTYDYIHEGRDGMQLEIKHNDTTMGVTRILGSHTLVPTSSNGLEFANTLGTVVNDSIAQIQHYQTQQEILQTNLSSWKDTAEKLDRDWQQEKDLLLNRFLQLYKRAHLQLRESQSKVQQLQEELMLQARAVAIDNHNNNNNKSPSCKKQKRAPRPPLPPPLPTYTSLPDDNDAQQFDSEMVNMLAAGKTMEKSLVEKKRKRSSSSSSTTADGVGGAIRTNPHTGAKEVFDANVLFDDPSFFASSLQTMDSVDETNDKEESAEAKTKTTSANGQDVVEVVVDPVMAIAASKLPAKARANHKDKDKDSPQSKRHAKKDSTRVNGNDKDGRVTRTDEVMEDPVMAAAGKLFAAKENKTSNSDGGS
jgi:hypothetical protein